MNKYYLNLLICLFLVINIFGQTIIKGNFPSLPTQDFRIAYNQSALNEFKGETFAEGKTNTNGQFSSAFILSSEQPVILFISNQFLRVWLIPNTTLIIEETAKGKLLFSGQSAIQNEFLYESGIMIPIAVSSAISATTFEPPKQLEYLDSIEQKRWILYNRKFSRNEISKKFATYCEGEIKYFSYLNKSQYILQNIFAQKNIKQEDIPINYFYFWKNFKLLDDSCVSDSYRNSLRDYIAYMVTKQLNLFNDIPDKEKYFKTDLYILDSLLTDHPITKESMKGEILIFLINYFDLPELVDLQLINYKKEFPTSEYINLIQEKQSKKNKNTFSNIYFTLQDISGKQFDIKSLKGKVVYIDFWGSWCKACLAQMPNSLKLQQIFKNKDVSFLFIDFYDTKDKWLKAVKDKKIRGIHVKAEKNNEKYFDEKFGIGQGFPRYALLDKNGVLITSSAPHPNDKDAALLIEKYLK